MKWPPVEIIESVGFDVVAHSWIKDEWTNKEYNQYRGTPLEQIVQKPNFENSEENNKRSEMLMQGRHVMISQILIEAEWYKVKITKENEKRIYLCPSIEWTEFSNGTYKVSGTLSNIFPDSKVDIQRADKIKEIVTAMQLAPKVNGLIIVGSNLDSAFSIIEGCHRFIATAYLTQDKDDGEIIADTAYLGISPEMNNYNFYIGKYRPGL